MVDYKADWTITLKGNGKVVPVVDIDAIGTLFETYLADLIAKGHDMNLDATIIITNGLEEIV